MLTYLIGAGITGFLIVLFWFLVYLSDDTAALGEDDVGMVLGTSIFGAGLWFITLPVLVIVGLAFLIAKGITKFILKVKPKKSPLPKS